MATLGYDITKNWSSSFNFMSIERVDDYASAKEDHVNIYQIE